jgi:hypothetical protein
MSGKQGMTWNSATKSLRASNKRLRAIIQALPRTPDPNELAQARQLARTETMLEELSTRLLTNYDAETSRSYTNLANLAMGLRRDLGLVNEEPEQRAHKPPSWLELCTDEEVEWLRDLLVRIEQRRAEQAQATTPTHPVVTFEEGDGRYTGPPPVTFSKIPGSQK